MSKFVDYFKTFNMKKLFFILITIVLLFLIISNIILLCFAFPPLQKISIKTNENKTSLVFSFPYNSNAILVEENIRIEPYFLTSFSYQTIIPQFSTADSVIKQGDKVYFYFVDIKANHVVFDLPTSVKVFINNKLYAVYKS